MRKVVFDCARRLYSRTTGLVVRDRNRLAHTPKSNYALNCKKGHHPALRNRLYGFGSRSSLSSMRKENQPGSTGGPGDVSTEGARSAWHTHQLGHRFLESDRWCRWGSAMGVARSGGFGKETSFGFRLTSTHWHGATGPTTNNDAHRVSGANGTAE